MSSYMAHFCNGSEGLNKIDADLVAGDKCVAYVCIVWMMLMAASVEYYAGWASVCMPPQVVVRDRCYGRIESVVGFYAVQSSP